METTVQPVNGLPAPSEHTRKLRELSQDLESAFLSEMLKHAGFGETSDTTGGGIGEEQFRSFLISEHAQALTQAGGIGLAESIFQSLIARAK